MKTYLLFVSAILIPHVQAAPKIGLVRATPLTALIGTPTPVTVTASISNASLIPESVNLLQLNADGTTTVLGALHDDGMNGDAFAGDLVFTFVATLDAQAATQIELQVSAAFKGELQRMKSNVLSIFFQPANAPQQAIAALAQNLSANNIAAAMNYLVVSNKNTTALNALGQQGLNVLASILQTAKLVRSQNDLRVFQAPFVTPGGSTTTVEFSMIPGPNGRWLINSW